MPDQKKLGNAGSFFKNPIVPKRESARLLQEYPNMPYYQIDGAFDKIPAGWLIEQAGFKGPQKGKSRHARQASLGIGKLRNFIWKSAVGTRQIGDGRR